MTDLQEQFHRIISRSTSEDLEMIGSWLSGLEKKQQGQFSTYLSAALHFSKTIEDDRCIVSVPNTAFIHNSIGIPHGGILVTLLDTAMGTLATSRCPQGYATVTSNLTTHFLSVADADTLSAEAVLIRQGQHMIVVEGKILQPDGRLIAHATGSFFIIPH